MVDKFLRVLAALGFGVFSFALPASAQDPTRIRGRSGDSSFAISDNVVLSRSATGHAEAKERNDSQCLFDSDPRHQSRAVRGS